MTTITLPRATVEQALEALTVAWQQNPRWQITEGMHALRAALAQQAEPVEPVAWLTPGQDLHLNNGEGFRFSDWTPLYTAPPQRKPLTQEEIAVEWRKASECAGKSEGAVTTSQFVEMFARGVEAKHGIKESP